KFKLRLSCLPRRDPSRARDPCPLRSRAPACPKLRQTARADRSPRAAHEHAARDQPLRRTRSGSTKTGSHTSTSTSPPRTTRDERAAPRSRNCCWPSVVNRCTIAESKAFLYIYAPFAIELALRFRPFKIKNATGLSQEHAKSGLDRANSSHGHKRMTRFQMEAIMATGTVKFFNAQKGYGFIVQDAGG